MKYDVGSIVKARGREWVVLPGSTEGLVHVEPLGGTVDERTQILTTIEDVASASFPLPDPSAAGDAASARLLLQAAQLSNRHTTGPFRCLGRVSIEPRPYQLVPLLLALRRNPARLLIADDVGVGKTVEALLIARELYDRGEIQRFCVLCPPHLAEQWQRELKDKFHLDAELYTARTATRVERHLAAGESVFERFPVVVASIDYVKQERRRDHFIQHAPELIIVDEAHTATKDPASRVQHYRHWLVDRLSRDRDRHLILVTATPHTGKEDAFRGLVSLLDPGLAELPDELSGDRNRTHRERLAQFMVQRRRKDLQHYLENTPFPKRLVREEHYVVPGPQRELLREILEYARGEYSKTGDRKRQRIVYWSLISLLRSFASSPEAAIATLQQRSPIEGAASAEEADRMGQTQIEDTDDESEVTSQDVPRGARLSEGGAYDDWIRRLDAFRGSRDAKLTSCKRILEDLFKEGCNPIVFCQFIPTAKYVASFLASSFPEAQVIAVTGEHPPQERERIVAELAQAKRRILVATDCLSEGINLQDGFDAVLHYDLAWVPTRHEQREGRVDRYGQPKKEVYAVTYYGQGNLMDGLVLEVLLRKHNSIRSTTGVSVPVPQRSKELTETIMETVFLRTKQLPAELSTPDLGQYGVEGLHKEWEDAASREKGSPTLFAQRTIKDEEVKRELDASRTALGEASVVEAFVRTALQRLAAGLEDRNGTLRIDPTRMEPEARDVLGLTQPRTVTFDPEAPLSESRLHRTHPLVETLAAYVLETALDGLSTGIATRCAATVTSLVKRPTTLLLVRYRYQLTLRNEPRLVEETQVLAFSGEGQDTSWLADDQALRLLEARPEGNLPVDAKRVLLETALTAYPRLMPQLRRTGETRRDAILETHERVRSAANLKLGRIRLEVQGDPDILGIFIFVPKEASR